MPTDTEKTCIKCGRTGTRQFIADSDGWVCVAKGSCRGRVDEANATPPAEATCHKCGRTGVRGFVFDTKARAPKCSSWAACMDRERERNTSPADSTTPASMGGPLSEAERIAEIRARLDAASSMPWEAGDVWGWAGLVWTADGTRDWNGNGTRCSYCRDSDPVDVKVRDINGEEMMAHLHRLPEPWDLDSAISDADGELVVRSVPDPADHNLILHAPVDLAYLLSRVGVLEGQLAKAADPVNGPVQLAIHRAVCEDSLAHCVENRGRCVRSAEAASWALGLDGGGSDA